MNDKMKNLLIRSLSGAVMIAVFIGAVFLSPISYGLLLLAVTIGCTIEYYRLCSRCGISPQKFVGISASILLFAAGFSAFALATMNLMDSDSVIFLGAMGTAASATSYLFVISAISFVCELWRGSKTPIANTAVTLAGLFYVVLPMTTMLFLPLLLAKGEWRPSVVLAYMFIVWSNDVFAYVVGCTIGRHKMWPRISPKKSWEGFVGGIAGSMLVAWGASALVGGNAAWWCGLAVVVSVTGVAGDLVESMFKRAADVKDSGSIMPGHGGWLDRFDAMLISTPFAFIYALFMQLFQ